MKFLDAISFQSIFLIVFGVATFLLLIMLFTNRKKTYRAASMLSKAEAEITRKKANSKEVIQYNAIDAFFAKTKFLAKFSPYNIITDARKVEWNIGYKEYVGMLLAAAAVLSSLFYVYLGKSFLCIYVSLGAIFFPRIMLYFKNEQYKMHRRDRIAIFMKAVSNSMSVFGNAIDAIEEVIPLAHESLRADLTKTVALLKSGKSLSFSFSGMLEKYSYEDFHFFIDMLEVAHEHGGESDDILTNISNDFDQTKVLQFKLIRAMAIPRKAFYQNGVFVAILPLIFLFVEHGQLYLYLTTGYMNGLLGEIAMVLNFAIIMFFWYKQEKISKFNFDGEE